MAEAESTEKQVRALQTENAGVNLSYKAEE